VDRFDPEVGGGERGTLANFLVSAYGGSSQTLEDLQGYLAHKKLPPPGSLP